MVFGENGAVVSNAPSAPPGQIKASGTLREPGIFNRPNRHIKRNKLACFVSSLLAVLFVSLTALLVMWVFSIFSLMSSNPGDIFGSNLDDTPFGTGVMLAVFVSIYNFILFMIVVPVAWLVISQTVGRLAHRGISDRWAYIRWTAFVGAVLVGLTSTIPGFWSIVVERDTSFVSDALGIAAGGFLMGASIGGVAGTGVGALFVLILRPSAQLKGQELKTADVF